MKHSHVATALILAYHATTVSATDSSCLITSQQLCQNQTLFNSIVNNLSFGTGNSAVTVTSAVWQGICQQYNSTSDVTQQLAYNLLPLLANAGNTSITQPIVNTVQQLLTTYPLNSLAQSTLAQAKLQADVEGQLLLNTYNSLLVQLSNGLLPGLSSICDTTNSTSLLEAIGAETNVWQSALFSNLHNLTLAAQGALVLPAVSSYADADALKSGPQCTLPVQQWSDANVNSMIADYIIQAKDYAEWIVGNLPAPLFNIAVPLGFNGTAADVQQIASALITKQQGAEIIKLANQTVSKWELTFSSALVGLDLNQQYESLLSQITSSGVPELADQLRLEVLGATSNLGLSCLKRNGDNSVDMASLYPANNLTCASSFNSNATLVVTSTVQAMQQGFLNSSAGANLAPATIAMLRDQLHAYNGGFAAGSVPACVTPACPTGSQACVVYNASTQTAAYTCFDPSVSVCNLLTQTLCSVSTPAACGSACYNPYKQHCQVNTTDLRSSTVADGQAAALTDSDSRLAANSTSKSTSGASALASFSGVTLAGAAAILVAALM